MFRERDGGRDARLILRGGCIKLWTSYSDNGMMRGMSLWNRDAEQVTAGPRSTPAATAEGGRAKEICHSTKRTHRFFDVKQHLSIRHTIGYTRNFCEKTVGSFWKTNPPERGFGGLPGCVFDGIGLISGHVLRGRAVSGRALFNAADRPRRSVALQELRRNLDCPGAGFGV